MTVDFCSKDGDFPCYVSLLNQRVCEHICSDSYMTEIQCSLLMTVIKLWLELLAKGKDELTKYSLVSFNHPPHIKHLTSLKPEVDSPSVVLSNGDALAELFRWQLHLVAT